MTTILLFGAAVCAAALLVAGPATLAAYRRFRGTRLVTCPETDQPAAVKVDARHAALTAAVEHTELRLSSCSRWPERRDCGQACLRQVEAAPEDCLVRTIVARWYEGKRCVLCGRSFESVKSWGNALAVMGPDGETTEWSEVEIPQLPETFRSHWPVCWNCHMAESFRRKYPELVIDAPRTRADRH